MTYEIYRYIFIGGAALAGIMLVVSILLFVVLRIPTVIGDLTGSNARKAIEQIRNQNESTGHKTYKSSTVNRERGRLTDKISPSGNLIRNETGGSAMATEKIATQKFAQNETTVLEEQTVGNETTVLDAYQTGGNETTVLSNAQSELANVFAIEFEITYIHTSEIITN